VLSCPPATAELPLRVYEWLFHNHGEGPHRFLASREVKALLDAAGLEVQCHESTLFIPAGPRWLRRLDPLVERVVGKTPLGELGIRQFFVCERKKSSRHTPCAVADGTRSVPATLNRADFRSLRDFGSLGIGPWQDLMRDVVQTELCTRCGTCVGVCPSGVLEFTAIDDECLPAAVRPEACVRCGLCAEACPGRRVSFAAVRAAAADAPIQSELLGPIRRIRIAHARDPAVRNAGASGGAVTAMLCDLLERGEITGAVVLDWHPEAPWRPWPRVARTRDEIVRAAQSKYCVTPTNVAIGEISPQTDRLAVVVLPCQIHALRTLESRGHPSVKAVSLIVGLYCGNQLHFGATRSFLKRHGVRDLSQVAEIRYRDGQWPGCVRCLLKDGRTVAAPKFHFNHLISFYVIPRCLLCADLAAEGADISVADAWDARRGRESFSLSASDVSAWGKTLPPTGKKTPDPLAPPSGGGGWSLVLSRTERGESTVSHLAARGVLHVEEIDLNRALTMHAHGLDLKKTGALMRVRRLARRGKPAPQYDLPQPNAPLRRRLAELFIGWHFGLFRTRLARWIIDRIPFGLVGRLYVAARSIWRNTAARRFRAEGRGIRC
jgi:coenzyme F420 hydrogenase subunit beta